MFSLSSSNRNSNSRDRDHNRDSKHNSNSQPFVVVIHGLHQRSFIMRPLAKRLRHYGFRTHIHDYHSMTQPISAHSKSLNVWLEANHDPNTPIHLVGHSLGGLVMRDFIKNYPKWQIDRCVTLGTPHLGSVTGDYAMRLSPLLVGRAYKNGLDGNIADIDEGIELGVIAGDRPYGLGQFFLNHNSRKSKLTTDNRAHDGTVYVSETRLPNAADHLVMNVSHTGMLGNKDVAKQTAYFLKHGQFNREAAS